MIANKSRTIPLPGIKQLKSVTPGSRFASRSDFSDLTSRTPEKSLTKALRKSGGRNNTGRITIRRRGGGHKRRYRLIDFKRDKYDIPGRVMTVEYDPNRSSRIALIKYVDGDWRYILAPNGIKIGDPIMSGPNASIDKSHGCSTRSAKTGVCSTKWRWR